MRKFLAQHHEGDATPLPGPARPTLEAPPPRIRLPGDPEPFPPERAAPRAIRTREVDLLPEQASFSGLCTRPRLAMRYPSIHLLPGQDRRLRAGHPWVYSNELVMDAAAKALACYDNIYWIAGGKPKEGGLAGLEPFYPRIRRAYLIGEAAAAFAATLGEAVPYEISGTLERAVQHAAADAEKDGAGPVAVLLSPACASFDQYKNFEVRGDAFVGHVAALPGVTMLIKANG